ncbi:MAG: response regulator [Candidatus Daviesbacteria bacterium]|nr:response regulator [Candidatus Daviesbacteria bacterium]
MTKILIVEDDQFIREFYEELLIQEGYTVETAIDGEMALAKIKQGGWNVIMLDIMLPKLDGLQILKSLKAGPPINSNGPIIVLTNLGNNTVINQAFELGASGYLIKSAMNPDEILKEIKNFLTKQ